MITTIDIRISAGHVNLPIPLSAVIAGSAATVNVGGVPGRKQGVAIDGVAVVVTNPAGVQQSFDATAQGGQWVATVPATMFASAGSARNGVVVEASGKDETNASRTWRLGMGDLVVIAADPTATSLGELQTVKLRSVEPSQPSKGDLYKFSGTWKIYNGTAWEAFGSGVTDYNNLEGKPQIAGVTLTGNKSAADLGLATAQALGDKVSVSALGVAGGVAQLGSDGKLKDSQMPAIPEPPTPVPIDPAEATDDGQFADALATKTALAGKVDTNPRAFLVGDQYGQFVELNKRDAEGDSTYFRLTSNGDVYGYNHTTSQYTQLYFQIGKSGTLALTSELPYAKSTSAIGTRQVYTLTATSAQSVTLPTIPNTDEVLNCDIVVNGTGASADFGLTLVGGTGVNVYYPDGEAITCKAGCITMVSSVGINGIGWLVVGCNNLKTAS